MTCLFVDAMVTLHIFEGTTALLDALLLHDVLEDVPFYSAVQAIC